jgi:hypothetical protein
MAMLKTSVAPPMPMIERQNGGDGKYRAGEQGVTPASTRPINEPVDFPPSQ